MFNGTASFVCDAVLPSSEFSSDACDVGGAAFFEGDWMYSNWATDYPAWADDHINVLELKTVLLAATMTAQVSF